MSLVKFRLLCWKNFTLQKRHPVAGFFEIIFPVLIVLVFLFARNYVKTEVEKEILFKGFQQETFKKCNISYETVGVSTGGNYAIRDLIEFSVGKSKIKIKYFGTSRELDDFLGTTNGTVAGIEFDDYFLSVSRFKQIK